MEEMVKEFDVASVRGCVAWELVSDDERRA